MNKEDIITCHIYKFINKTNASVYVVAANIKEAIDIYESNFSIGIHIIETITTNAFIVP